MARTLRQVTVVGNSLEVTLARHLLEAYRLGKGALVEVRDPRRHPDLPGKGCLSPLTRRLWRGGGTARHARTAVTVRMGSRRQSAHVATLLQELKFAAARAYYAVFYTAEALLNERGLGKATMYVEARVTIEDVKTTIQQARAFLREGRRNLRSGVP